MIQNLIQTIYKNIKIFWLLRTPQSSLYNEQILAVRRCAAHVRSNPEFAHFVISNRIRSNPTTYYPYISITSPAIIYNNYPYIFQSHNKQQ